MVGIYNMQLSFLGLVLRQRWKASYPATRLKPWHLHFNQDKVSVKGVNLILISPNNELEILLQTVGIAQFKIPTVSFPVCG